MTEGCSISQMGKVVANLSKLMYQIKLHLICSRHVAEYMEVSPMRP